MSNTTKGLNSLGKVLFATVFATFLFAGASFAASATSADTKNVNLLVLPFQVVAGEQLARLDSEFPPLLGKQLASKGFRVVDNQTMLKVLDSTKLEIVDIAAARALAKKAGATHAVYGNITQLGSYVTIDARMVDASASAPTKSFLLEKEDGAANMQVAIQDLATRISGQFLSSKVLAGVEVRGTKVLDPEVVLIRLNTRKGDVIDSANTDREVKRIWDLGYFSDVRASIEQSEAGTILVYTVVEKPRVESITVEGSSAIKEKDILAAMGSKSGNILNEKLLSEDIKKILELYRTKGYYLAQVTPRFESSKEGGVTTVVLDIEEGKKLYISNIRFAGAEHIDQGDLKKSMMLKERHMFSWISGTGVLKEELIERDSAAIASFYLDHGFMDITVGEAEVAYTEDGIDITFPVSEGRRYKLGSVSISGDMIESKEALEKIIALDDLAKDKDYFNLSVMQNDTKKLIDFYADFGYAGADINNRPAKVVGEEPIVDVVYTIDKGHKVYVRRVLIEGNSHTRDNVILREMRVTDNEPFNGAKLRRSTERLNKLGFFEVAEAELVPTERADEVDLKIRVKEQPTGALMAGFGYSTFSNFGVSASISEKNLWGKGYNTSLQAALSGRQDSLTYSFTNPRFNDTNLAIGTDIYHVRDDFVDYRRKTTGGLLRFGYPLGEYTTLGWGYRLNFYKLYDVEEDASTFIKEYDTGQRFSSTAVSRITRDTTNRERPTNGTINTLTAEYTGGILAGDDDFISFSAEHQTYYELATNHVLHGRIKGAALVENGSNDIPVFERFWMGGINSVRGYNSRNIVPRDPLTNDRIGGTRMAFANLEYIWSVSNDVGINLVPFFDIGVNIDKDHPYNFSDEVFRSYGLEARWRSPLGDLRFSYGIPLDEDRRGKRSSGRFEFSMGQFF